MHFVDPSSYKRCTSWLEFKICYADLKLFTIIPHLLGPRRCNHLLLKQQNRSYYSWYQVTNLIQNFKLLDELVRYSLYYFLTHFFKQKLFRFETCIDSYYIVLNFYQINKDSEIQTCDRLVIKALLPFKKSIQPKNLNY